MGSECEDQMWNMMSCSLNSAFVPVQQKHTQSQQALAAMACVQPWPRPPRLSTWRPHHPYSQSTRPQICSKTSLWDTSAEQQSEYCQRTPHVDAQKICKHTVNIHIQWTHKQSPAWPAKDCLDGSNEDVKIKIDFVTESSQHASEWVPACLSCHCFLCSP